MVHGPDFVGTEQVEQQGTCEDGASLLGVARSQEPTV